LINIGILETHFHIKYLYTMMRICKTKNTRVTVFTTHEIYERIQTYLEKTQDYEIILKKTDETENNYLKRVEQLCNQKIDLLFINTIQTSLKDAPHYIRFKPRSKMILTIHMVNHWLKAKFGFNIKNIFRSMDATLSILLIRTSILPKFNAITVIYPPIKEFIQQQTSYKKPVYTLPFNFYDETKKIPQTKKKNTINIVLPGLIEEHRRDYAMTLQVFEKIFKKYNKKITLDILGKPVGKHGKKIIEKCKQLKEKGYNIEYSTSFIQENEYNQRIQQADIIFSPLKIINKRDTGIVETYGTTEGSALPYEAVQYNKPLIVPEDFRIIKQLKTSTLTYKTADDLEKLLQELIGNEDKLKNLKKQAEKNSKYFSLETVQEYFTREILNKLDQL